MASWKPAPILVLVFFLKLPLFFIMPAGRLGPLAGSAHRGKFGVAVIDRAMMSCQGGCVLETKLLWEIAMG